MLFLLLFFVSSVLFCFVFFTDLLATSSLVFHSLGTKEDDFSNKRNVFRIARLLVVTLRSRFDIHT